MGFLRRVFVVTEKFCMVAMIIILAMTVGCFSAKSANVVPTAAVQNISLDNI